ncbi:OmpA/MotB family protein [Microbacterium sp. GXF7504]
MSVRRRRREAEPEHEGPDERWMASYLDMITVLMCLFIVLFAMSTVDKEKFQELANSLATGFGQTETERRDLAEGVVVPEELVEEDGTGFADETEELAQLEFDELSALREQLRSELAVRGLESAATFRIDEVGLTVGLVSAETLFATNSTQLTGKAVDVLDAVGNVLSQTTKEISVEGHADYRTPSSPFPTNWELSSGRSTQVLRFLVESKQIPATKIRAVGFGDARPVSSGTTDQELAADRRVDIVVLSDASEEVRHLVSRVAQTQPAS